MGDIAVKLARLPARGVIEVAGADRVAFLQGLVSNDVARALPGRAVWAAMLTPQGKWITDFFIFAATGRLLLDCERDGVARLLQRLGRYRLRADVRLSDRSHEIGLYVAWDGSPSLPSEPVAMAPDPRLDDAGTRILSVAALAETATPEDWDRHRLALGLPDGSRDLEAEKTVLLEAGFDELGGVSWSKGCYMGQELTARTKYRGLVKRRLVPVAIEGEKPPAGAVIVRDGQEVGVMRSALGDVGLAQLRLDALDGGVLECGAATLVARPPAWMRLPEPASS